MPNELPIFPIGSIFFAICMPGEAPRALLAAI